MKLPEKSQFTQNIFFQIPHTKKKKKHQKFVNGFYCENGQIGISEPQKY